MVIIDIMMMVSERMKLGLFESNQKKENVVCTWHHT